MKNIYKHWRVYICILVFILLPILAVCVYWDYFYINNDKVSFYIRYADSNYFKVEDVKLEVIVSIIISYCTFLLAIVSLNYFRKRVKNQDEQVKQQIKQVEQQVKQVEQQVKQVDLQREQIDLQIDQRTDERFTTAVSLLGSSESSARTGAIYALYHLAVDDEDKKYRKQIAQILCSHIRSKTQEGDYQKKHKERPSNEIQTCINLLFQSESEGLYTKYAAGLDKADLSYAYLVGANFWEAECQDALFTHAQCQGAAFTLAQCQGANFWYAQCQGAGFVNAQCQGAGFVNAQCQGALFWGAQCQGADFSKTECQGAKFAGTNLRGAYALEAIKIELAERVGKESELKTMVFAGPLNDEAVKAIEVAIECVSDFRYKTLQGIITDNENEKVDCTVSIGIITGVLEDSEEIQAIIAKDWDKFKELEKS